jgi:hypothetical protein
MAVIRDYLPLRDEKELLHFCALLPYLSEVLLGRADLVTIIKGAIKVDIKLETVDSKRKRVKTILGFEWGEREAEAIKTVKDAILNRLRSGGDLRV